MTVLVGGGAADVTDVVDRVAADFPRTALFIIVTTYLVLFVLLRSVILPAKALLMNTLSLTASFGALVWIFQDGNLSAVLAFQPLGFVETTLPVILFCVLFGLSMDYEVFLLSRMKEAWDRTGDNTEAVARGLERSGRIVTSAALIVVVVAGSFAFADIVLIKALGLGVAIAVALDATVVRALLVPGHDAPARPLELVDAGLAGALRGQPPARLRGGQRAGRRGRGGDPMTARRRPRRTRRLAAVVAAVVVVVAGCTPASGPILANPSAPRPSIAPPTEPPVAAADPQPVELPRDDGPHDRLTEWWYYTGHLASDDGRRFGFEYVIFRAERGAFPTTWASHLAVTDETGDAFHYAQRLEVGPQVDRSPRGVTGELVGFDLSLSGIDPTDPATFGRPAWAMAGTTGTDRLQASLAPDEAAAAGVPGGLGPGPAAAGDQAAGPPRHGRLDRLRAGRRLVLLLADGHGCDGLAGRRRRDPERHRRRLVRPPVGRLHQRRRRRLGLVRREPRRRHRPDHLAGPRRRRQLSARSTARWSTRTARRPTWIATRSRVEVDRPLDEPATGADYPAGWRIAIPAEALTIDLDADRRRPGARHAGDDRGRLLGGLAGRDRQLRAGTGLGGQAYVELTGYAPSSLAAP